MSESAVDQLRAAIERHGVEPPEEALPRLADYAARVWELNQQINLTRHTTWDLFVTRDLLDTMQLSALLHAGEEVLDVGSGGGVPGALLAILRPDLDVSLCDSVAKKAKVLAQLADELQLPVGVHHERAEALLEDMRFDALVARAVGPLWKLCKWFEPHWASIGRLLAIKGPNWPAERGEARHRGLLGTLHLRRAAAYTTPGTEVESVILKIWPHGRDEK